MKQEMGIPVALVVLLQLFDDDKGFIIQDNEVPEGRKDVEINISQLLRELCKKVVKNVLVLESSLLL